MNKNVYGYKLDSDIKYSLLRWAEAPNQPCGQQKSMGKGVSRISIAGSTMAAAKRSGRGNRQVEHG